MAGTELLTGMAGFLSPCLPPGENLQAQDTQPLIFSYSLQKIIILRRNKL